MKDFFIHIITYAVFLPVLFIIAVWIWATFADVFYRITGRQDKSPLNKLRS